MAQSSELEFLKIWRPEDHKVVPAEFAISGIQCLWRAIVLDCFFNGMEAFFGWSVKIKILNSPLPKSWPSTSECDGRFLDAEVLKDNKLTRHHAPERRAKTDRGWPSVEDLRP